MKGSDRAILLALPALAAIAAFWFLVLAPKREEATKLGGEVASLEESVTQQEQLASVAEEAREHYSRNYYRLVSLGKAVPKDDDTASLLVELQGLADQAGVGFRSIVLDDAASTAGESAASTTAPPPGEGTSPAGASGAAGTPSAGAETSGADLTQADNLGAVPTAAATEAGAATLPIGATVGPAGLPVMPYKLLFDGDFFDIADFVASLDGMVEIDDRRVSARGRLLTIDGFNLSLAGESRTVPHLDATFAVTTYLTPAGQGVTAGGTAGAPPLAAPPASTQATSPATATTTGAAP